MDYIPRLFDVDDSERTEEELATLHQVGFAGCIEGRSPSMCPVPPVRRLC